MKASVSHHGFRLPVQSASTVHSTHVSAPSSHAGWAGSGHSLEDVHWTPIEESDDDGENLGSSWWKGQRKGEITSQHVHSPSRSEQNGSGEAHCESSKQVTQRLVVGEQKGFGGPQSLSVKQATHTWSSRQYAVGNGQSPSTRHSTQELGVFGSPSTLHMGSRVPVHWESSSHVVRAPRTRHESVPSAHGRQCP